MADEERLILATLTQTWDAQAENIEAEVKIAPERALHYALFEIAVGRHEDANIEGDSPRAANGANLFFLDGTQHLRLQIDAQLSYLVEKDGSSFGHRHDSILGLIRARKSTLHVAEEFALDQCVAAWLEFGIGQDLHSTITGRDRDPASTGHGAARIEHEIQKNLLGLGPVHLDETKIGIEMKRQLDVFSD